MNHENDTDPASPSSRNKAASSASAAPAAFPSSSVGTDPGIGSAPHAAASAGSSSPPINCPPPSNRPQIPSPPVTQPRLPHESSTSPAPAPVRISASAGTPLPPPGSNDSMDVLLEAIGSQDKPFVPKRTSATAGERSAAYEGQARAVPPATTDPTPGASVIVTLPEPMPPTVTKKIPRRDVDSALKMAGAASLPKRAENTTIVVDPPGPSNKLLRWTVAGVLIAACFVGAAGIHNAVERARENHTNAGATGAAAAPVVVESEHAEAPPAQPVAAPPAVAVAVERPPIEPVRAVLPELPTKKGARGARAAKVPSGLSETEAAQAATAAAMAAPSTPATAAAPKKPKPNVPGLEDLKTEY